MHLVALVVFMEDIRATLETRRISSPMSSIAPQNHQPGHTTSAKIRANNIQIREFLLHYSGPAPVVIAPIHNGHTTSLPRLDLGENSIMYAG